MTPEEERNHALSTVDPIQLDRIGDRRAVVTVVYPDGSLFELVLPARCIPDSASPEDLLYLSTKPPEA